MAVDGQGNVYISDFFNSRVRKVTPGGTITAFAGTGLQGSSGDGGPATSARLLGPQGVAVDKQGNVYIVDGNADRVRKVDAAGTITTFAGTGLRGFSGDGGPATSARLNNPYGVAVDGKGNVYIADLQNFRVRKVNPGGTITTFAGGGSSLGDGGPATSARVRNPHGVAVDGQGNVYIADRVDHRVRKVSPAGTISTFAGTGAGGFSGDGGPANSARLFAPWGVAVDGKGNVYIGDAQNYRVRKVTIGAALTVSVGGTAMQPLLAQEGITITAKCNRPCSLAATGSVSILGTKHVFGLSRATAKLAAGKRTLRLAFLGSRAETVPQAPRERSAGQGRDHRPSEGQGREHEHLEAHRGGQVRSRSLCARCGRGRGRGRAHDAHVARPGGGFSERQGPFECGLARSSWRSERLFEGHRE